MWKTSSNITVGKCWLHSILNTNYIHDIRYSRNYFTLDDSSMCIGYLICDSVTQLTLLEWVVPGIFCLASILLFLNNWTILISLIDITYHGFVHKIKRIWLFVRVVFNLSSPVISCQFLLFNGKWKHRVKRKYGNNVPPTEL